jgi:peptidoglycan/LPS O-acetylase OafA/YrhL
LRPLIWTGSISAALFVIHPALRKLIIGHYARYDIEAGLLLYIVSAIAVAWLFSLIINRIPRPKL